MMNKVFIGMPVFNGEKYIKNSIDSLLAQTHTNFVLYISDNSSTDNTGKICKEYEIKDSRVIYHRNNENIGAAKNFQLTLDVCSEDLFMWAAYDDLWDANYIEKAVNLINSSNVNYVFPSFKLSSINFKINKIIDSKLFKYIESSDPKIRVINYINMHHNSHKCNIVYSLFRSKFIKEALYIQDIGNDGVLGAIICKMGPGKILPGKLFSKRYPNLWPGADSLIKKFLFKDEDSNFIELKNATKSIILLNFPNYGEKIKEIFDSYKQYKYFSEYKILRNL